MSKERRFFNHLQNFQQGTYKNIDKFLQKLSPTSSGVNLICCVQLSNNTTSQVRQEFVSRCQRFSSRAIPLQLTALVYAYDQKLDGEKLSALNSLLAEHNVTKANSKNISQTLEFEHACKVVSTAFKREYKQEIKLFTEKTL